MSKLLIADSYPDVNKSLKNFFDKMGLITSIAGKADEILNAVNQEKPDIVIMDMRFDNVDRWDVVEKIKSTVPNTKIIIMSTYGKDEIAEELQKYAIKNYIDKPIDMKELLNIVKKELGET